MTDARQILLSHLLLNAPFEGWTDSALRQASVRSGISFEETQRHFPDGIRDVLIFYGAYADRRMVEALDAYHFDSMKIRDRIALAVMTRLNQNLTHREAIRRAALTLAMPHYAALSLKLLYATVDAIWHATGDRSTDFSFYTKRLILAGVYASTLAVWLDDESPNRQDTRDFLDRRIANVMQIGMLKSRMKLFGVRCKEALNGIAGGRPA